MDKPPLTVTYCLCVLSKASVGLDNEVAASLFWLLDFEALLSVVHMACVLEYAEV